jgi:hypothetical protein
MPPRTKRVSPLRVYWKKIINYISCRKKNIFTVKEVRFQVNVEDVFAQTLNGVIKWKYVHSLAVLNVKALVYINEVLELHSQVVAGNFVHLDPAFFYVIRT